MVANESSLLLRGSGVRSGDVVSVSPNGSTWHFISFRVVRINAGQRVEDATGNNEVALVVINGTANIRTSAGTWNNVGVRADPFSGPPAALYLPAATGYLIEAVSDVEIAVCAATERERHPARLIAPAPDSSYIRGEGEAQRRIQNILMGDDEAGSLFLTEVITFPGNWSSYPPHKHDEDNLPVESQLEEIYYYRTRPASGFAFQRVYSADGELDETMTVHNADAVLVPHGYHVCAAAAKYWVYYLNVLAGPKHVYRMSFDPAHAWIKENWVW